MRICPVDRPVVPGGLPRSRTPEAGLAMVPASSIKGLIPSPKYPHHLGLPARHSTHPIAAPGTSCASGRHHPASAELPAASPCTADSPYQTCRRTSARPWCQAP
ncbi:hypothetical protein [Ornithinimicrobium kibberense]|uniref:hypothetical protein n=1 Tax=Ornithinimicrobium kibberense TaxID=282060 RepID=UPI00361A2680